MKKKKPSGFTLLELMIGLALLGLILLLLFGALRLGSRSWDAGEKKLETASSQTVVAGYLRRSLSQVYPWRFKQAEKQVLAFEGTGRALRYVGWLADQQGVAGLHLHALELEENELVLRWSLPDVETDDFSALDEAEKVVLHTGIEDFALAYYGAQEAEDELAWHEDWRSSQFFPALIRLTVTPVGGPAWPEILVAPKLSINANCVWDEFYRRCRTLAEPQAGKTPAVAGSTKP